MHMSPLCKMQVWGGVGLRKHVGGPSAGKIIPIRYSTTIPQNIVVLDLDKISHTILKLLVTEVTSILTGPSHFHH